MTPFVPTPVADLSDPKVRERFRAALDRVRSELPRNRGLPEADSDVPPVEELVSRNPADPGEVIGRVPTVQPSEVEALVEVGSRAFAAWRRTSPEDRIRILTRAAHLMRERRERLSALVLLETGKTWPEADGEVAESVDFLEYHAREYRKLLDRAESCLHRHPLESNTYRYLPLGVGAVLPPWPFPIAQLTAMASAAVVTGNCVVAKPASLAPVTSRAVLDIFWEAGSPPDVLGVAFGPGESVGRSLVRHPGVRFVTLTGSTDTGREVFEAASQVGPGQPWFKRVMLELAGKNSVVVDETADLDAAADAIVSGAFSFQGQKCSAGSNAIVVRSVYDDLVERIVSRVERLVVGNPSDFATDVGPLIDRAAVDRVRAWIDIGRSDARLAVGGGESEAGEAYVPPTVFIDVPPSSRIAREEILGPVLSVVPVRDVSEALEVANAGPLGLTGSFFSTDEERIAMAMDDFHVGSLYLNRKPTASEVGFHPFGGFGLSGTDAKAGGPDYLMHYVQAQTISRR